MALKTLQELYAYNLWANERIFDAISALPAEQVNRSLEMGPGSIRATFWHNCIVERVWYERVNGAGHANVPARTADDALVEIQSAARILHSIRGDWLNALTDADLARMVDFQDRQGNPWTRRLSDILLHVCNHGVYHRAQIVNMIRQCGGPVPKPGADYIFMNWDRPRESMPALELGLIRRYYAYGDAVRREMHAAAEGLGDDRLNRPFEMGVGSLRRTLVHVFHGEWWWHENWTKGPGTPFPKPDEGVSISELSARFDEVAAARNAMLDAMSEADLARPVEVAPRPDLRREFPIGVTMLQLCTHGTHHRAQANNMLRHLGAEPLKLDLILWARD